MKQQKVKGCKELNDKDFNDFIKEGLVLIDFWNNLCMPCLVLAPILDELSEKFKGKIKFGKVDVGAYPNLAIKFCVRSIPNLTLLKDGKVIDQFVGSISGDGLENKLNKYLE